MTPPRSPKLLLPFTPHENIYNIPNLLTFSRLLSSPLLGWLILHDHYPPALALLVFSGITDLLDGYIARKYKLQTVVGSVIDPMADKMLITILTVTLAIKGLLPTWLAVIIMGRDVGLAISAIWYRWISLPEPKTFMRYWDFSLPSAEVRPTAISKVGDLVTSPWEPDLIVPFGIDQHPPPTRTDHRNNGIPRNRYQRPSYRHGSYAVSPPLPPPLIYPLTLNYDNTMTNSTHILLLGIPLLQRRYGVV